MSGSGISPIAEYWLQAQWQCLGEIRLIVDGTKIGFWTSATHGKSAYRKRAIPIAWTWVSHVRGHSTAHKQLALLNYVKTLYLVVQPFSSRRL